MKSSLAIGKEEVDGEVDPNRVEVWEMWIFNLYFGLFSPTSFPPPASGQRCFQACRSSMWLACCPVPFYCTAGGVEILPGIYFFKAAIPGEEPSFDSREGCGGPDVCVFHWRPGAWKLFEILVL